jgi:hypothetical protein
MSGFRSVTPRSTSYRPRAEQRERKDAKPEKNLASIIESESSESPILGTTAPRPKQDAQKRKNLEVSERKIAIHAREDSGTESAEDAGNVVEIPRTVTASEDQQPTAPKQKLRPALQRQEKNTSIRKVVSEKPKRRTGLTPGQRQLPRPRPSNFSSQVPSLPPTPGEAGKANEINFDEKLFDFEAIETLLDPNADDIKIQKILIGTQEEHGISSNSTSQNEIESNPSKQKDLNEVAEEVDELRKYVNLELRQPIKRTEHAKPSNVASQILAPATSKKMAETVKNLIEGSEGDRSKSFRAGNIFLCAAGGTIRGNFPVICAPIIYPETDACAQKLISIPNATRYEYLKALYDQLSPYLNDEQHKLMRNSLANLYSATEMSKSPTLIKSALYSLRKDLEAQLSGG